MSLLKKYLGDPNIIEHLDFDRADYYDFYLDGQKLDFMSPDYSGQLDPDCSARIVHLADEHWKTEYSTTGPYQFLFSNNWGIKNQKLFHKEIMGTVRFSLVLGYRPNGSSFKTLHDVYSNVSHTISEDYRTLGGGMINRVEGYWTHEVTYSEKENDFFLLNNNDLNWLCGYKLSEGFIEDSFYHTLLNEDVVVELCFSRRMECPYLIRPAVIEAMNAAERDFIRHFKLETKDNTLAIQNMLAEQYQGKVLTLDDIAGASEPKLTLKHSD